MKFSYAFNLYFKDVVLFLNIDTSISFLSKITLYSMKFKPINHLTSFPCFKCSHFHESRNQSKSRFLNNFVHNKIVTKMLPTHNRIQLVSHPIFLDVHIFKKTSNLLFTPVFINSESINGKQSFKKDNFKNNFKFLMSHLC